MSFSKVTRINVNLKNLTAVISCRSKIFFYGSEYLTKYLQKCSDIERNSVPSNLDITTIEKYNAGRGRNSEFLKFWYMNCRSLSKKHEQLSRFLKKLDETSFLVVTETDIPEFYPCNSHHFVQQPRSSLTNVQIGGGVGIWAPKQLTVKMRMI